MIENLQDEPTRKLFEQCQKWGKYDSLLKKCGANFNASLGTNLREAGDAIVPWRLLGFYTNSTVESGKYEEPAATTLIENRDWLNEYKNKDKQKIISEKLFINNLTSKKFFDTHLVEAYVGDNTNTSGLYKWHSYRLAPVLDENGNIKAFALKNPHGKTDEIITEDDILDKIDSLSYAKIN